MLPNGKHNWGVCVELTFSDAGVRDLCCCRASLKRQYGAEVARRICCRLSVLAAAPSLAHLPSSPPIALSHLDGKGLFAVALGADYQLRFRAAVPKGRQFTDLSTIVEVLIIGPTPVPAARGRRK